MNKFLFAIVVCFITTGCSTIKAPKYHVSDQVQAVLLNSSATYNVASFTASQPARKTLCRLGGTVSPPDGLTFHEYVQKAFISELEASHKYDHGSPNTIHANLDEIKASSFMGRARWLLVLTVSNDAHESFTISYSHDYDASFVGAVACYEQMPKEFEKAVRELIKLVVNDSRFDRLFP